MTIELKHRLYRILNEIKGFTAGYASNADGKLLLIDESQEKRKVYVMELREIETDEEDFKLIRKLEYL